MTRFVDKYLAPTIQGWPVEVAPNFATQIARVSSGAETANRLWYDPLRDIRIPQGVRNQSTFEDLKRHWLVMGGPAKTWPWRDWSDFASVDLTRPNEEPTVSATDQVLGTGDGFTDTFQLRKVYDLGSPADPYTRDIHFPVLSSLLIAVNGTPTVSYACTRPGGLVTFNTPPALGAALTWGGFFDIQVRFTDDETLRGIMRTYGVSGFADIPLSEVRYCED